jgi:hypothetical protein
MGVVCFLLPAVAAGQTFRLGEFPHSAAGWTRRFAILHFIGGGYANFHANQSAGKT